MSFFFKKYLRNRNNLYRVTENNQQLKLNWEFLINYLIRHQNNDGSWDLGQWFIGPPNTPQLRDFSLGILDYDELDLSWHGSRSIGVAFSIEAMVKFSEFQD